MLKVININSPIDLTHHDCAFVEQVIDMAEKAPGWNQANSLSPLLDKIPVFLLDKDKFDNSFEGKSIKDPVNTETQPPEYIGVYTRLDEKLFNKIPSIFICPEKLLPIKNRSFQEMLADLLIHEFAHAKMDTSNVKSHASIPNDFYNSVEEPLANWFVIKYFYSYSNGKLFHSVKNSIKHEPANYSRGWDFFAHSISDSCWVEWRQLKETTINPDRIIAWMDAISNNYNNIINNLNSLLGTSMLSIDTLYQKNDPGFQGFVRGNGNKNIKDLLGEGFISLIRGKQKSHECLSFIGELIREKGSEKVIEIKGDLDFSNCGLDNIPEFLNNIIITGNFWCDNNNLISLDGCPKEIGGSFSCTNNKLTSLDGKPEVKGNFWY